LGTTKYDPDEFIGDHEAAADLGQKKSTLATWRSQGRGPAWYKFGRIVKYRRRDLDDYKARQRREPTKH
jgi:hypothetical protein